MEREHSQAGERVATTLRILALPFCPYCGIELQEGCVYCRKCGRRMHSETRELLEGRWRNVILAGKERTSIQSIARRALRFEEAPVQSKSQRGDLQAKDLETDRRGLLAKMKAFKKSRTRIQQLEEEVMELTAKKAELEEKIRELEAERNGLEKEIEELEEKLTINELEAKLAELQTQIRELGEKKRQLEEKIRLPEAAAATEQL